MKYLKPEIRLKHVQSGSSVVTLSEEYVEPLRPIFLTVEKYRKIFLKIKRRGPPVRDMPRHKLEVIKLLIIATEPVKLLSKMF